MRSTAVLQSAGAGLLALGFFAAVAFAIAAAPEKKAAGPVVLVTARYEGASAEVVADAVAAPIEQQINGVEGLLHIESESHADGRYIACVHFDPRTEPGEAVARTRNRVALAAPQLPEAVRDAVGGVQVEVAPPIARVKAPAAKAGTPAAKHDPPPAAKPAGMLLDTEGAVVLVLVDRADRGRRAMREWAAEVAQRLKEKEGAVSVVVFPPADREEVRVQFDREKLLQRGVSLDAATKAVADAKGEAPPDRKPTDAEWAEARVEALRKAVVKNAQGAEVRIADVAVVERAQSAAVVYRLDLHPAVKVVAIPRARAWSAAAARWNKLVAAESPAGAAVVDLTEK